ncbi:MAG TPA: restriction endonuclease subunit S [Longimicrobiales bacterium]|nr:restriction endonuclease subunit S [Longimicrobiales bacterium]
MIIGRKGAYRGVHYSPAPFFVIDTAFYLEPKVELDLRWAYYELLSRDINALDSGSAIPSTSRDAFYSLPVRVPPLNEQRAIADILGTLDDKIEVNRRMSETLEEMARALFESWFVRFDPVRAKMEGRDPGLPSDLADLFPDRLVESELGEIPEGWAVASLGDVADQIRENVTPAENPDAWFEHYSIPAFDAAQVPVSEPGREIKSQKSRVIPGSVLLSKLNPEIPRVWLVDVQREDRAICSKEFLVYRAREPHGRAWLYCLLRSSRVRDELQGMVTGTSKSHQRVPPQAILRIEVPKAPDAIAQTFERVVEPLLKRVLMCRHESRTLAALRDTLLPKLISGELRVKDAERLVAATT